MCNYFLSGYLAFLRWAFQPRLLLLSIVMFPPKSVSLYSLDDADMVQNTGIDWCIANLKVCVCVIPVCVVSL